MEEWKLEPARDHGMAIRERAGSLKRETGLVETGLHLAWWILLRTYLRALHRLEIRGANRLPPEPPFVLVANHSSHLDALTLSAALPWRLGDRAYPLAAGDTFFESLPIATMAAFLINALPIWRKGGNPKDLQELRERLVGEPCIFILFPEGTRARTGEMARFRPGVGMLVAGTDIPVVPCYLDGAFECWPPRQSLPRPGRMRLSIGEPQSFPSVANERTGWIEIAGSLERAVRTFSESPASRLKPGHA